MKENIFQYRILPITSFIVVLVQCYFWTVQGQNTEIVLPFGHSTHIWSLCPSPDGRTILSGAYNEIVLWDVQSGKEIRSYGANHGTIYAIRFFRDGLSFVSSTGDGSIQLWNKDSVNPVKIYKKHRRAVFCISLSRDDRHILSGSDDSTINYWDLNDINADRISNIGQIVKSVCLSPDGKMALVGSYKIIQVWDMINFKLVRTLNEDNNWVRSLCISDDGHYALSASCGMVKLWDLRKMHEKGKFNMDYDYDDCLFSRDPPRPICFVEDNFTALIGSKNRILKYNFKRQKVISDYWDGNYFGVVSGLSVINKGKYFISSCYRSISIWDSSYSTKLQTLKGHIIRPGPVSFLPNKAMAVCGNFAGVIHKWDFQLGKVNKSFKGHSNLITSLSISTDGKYLLSGSSDSTIRLWNDSTAECVQTFHCSSSDIRKISLTKNNKNVLSISSGPELIVWDINSGMKIINLMTDSFTLSDSWWPAAISRDAGYVIIGADSVIHVWDVKLRKKLKNFTNHKAFVMSVCFSNDGKKIVSCSADTSFLIWDPEQKGPVSSYKMKSLGDGISSCFTMDDKYVVTSTLLLPNEYSKKLKQSPSLKLWDVQTGNLVNSFDEISSDILSATTSFDGKFVLSSSADSKLRLWDLKSGQEVVALISIDSLDWLIITPDQYYTASKNALKYLSFRINKKLYDFEQFDVRFNRPDIVLERIGYAPKDLIALFRNAYYKRLKNLGFDTNSFHPGYDAPIIEILDKGEYTYSTSNPVFNLSFRASDSQDTLDRINIWVNEVPVFGIRGRSLKDFHTRSINMEIPVTLSDGENSIKVSCHNVATVESKKERRNITYNPVSVSPSKTYFIGIGVNRYMDSDLKLDFAVKDIRDQSGLLRSRCQNIDTLILFDSMVTVENLRALKKKLLKTNINDKVIMSFSGHGFIGRDTLFYFGTYDTDSRHPEQRGFSYDQIEWLLDSIPARMKLLLLDACNSGEVDRSQMSDDTTFANTPLNGKTRGSKGAFTPMEDTAPIGLENSFDLMQELFANLSNGSGAVVISAARAYQSAQEPEFLGNGVFTYKFIEGLRGAADKDHDGSITVNEIKEYVIRQVETYTGGEQNPTVRRDNLEVDWNVF